VVVALTQDAPLKSITTRVMGTPQTLAFTWAMPVATGLAFLVCVAGRRPSPLPSPLSTGERG